MRLFTICTTVFEIKHEVTEEDINPLVENHHKNEMHKQLINSEFKP